MNQSSNAEIRVAIVIACLVAAIAITMLSGCATSYDACKDPKSFIAFMPEQCHATFNRRVEWFE